MDLLPLVCEDALSSTIRKGAGSSFIDLNDVLPSNLFFSNEHMGSITFLCIASLVCSKITKTSDTECL